MNNKYNTDDDIMEIDLMYLGKAFLKKLWLIILIGILGGGIGFSIANFLITPLYEAKTIMYVNNNSNLLGNAGLALSSSDLSASQSLVRTYSVILKSRDVLEEVIRKDKLEYNYDELYDMIDTSPIDSTEVFEVTVTSSNPEEAENIANTIAKIVPGKIGDIVEGSSAKIVDYAVLPAHKSYPSISKFTLIGGMLGVLIAIAIIAFLAITNDQIKDESELDGRFGLPILANVPDLKTGKGKGYGYGYGYGKKSN